MSEATKNTSALEDLVFGKMEYKHSWCRTKSINWWQGKVMDVQITAHAYSGEGISESQRKAFCEYELSIDLIIKDYISKVKEYINLNYELNLTDEELSESLIPSNILFLKDGNWGVLFDAKFDIENGVALYKEKGEFKVGPQDDFL